MRMGDDLDVAEGSETEMEGWDQVVVENCDAHNDLRVGNINGVREVSRTIERDGESDVDLDMLVAVWF